ncbi:hypothetical protein J6590_075133 [Homalodisca vitripennis]|nr:hypothetical protein J6590_075133 [Homalodisca vitripennis]
MAKEDENEDVLPDKDAAKEFYAKYEPKEILGRRGPLRWGLGPAPSCICLSAVWIVSRSHSFVYTAATLPINVAIDVSRKLSCCFEVSCAVAVAIRDVSFNSNSAALDYGDVRRYSCQPKMNLYSQKVIVINVPVVLLNQNPLNSIIIDILHIQRLWCTEKHQ